MGPKEHIEHVKANLDKYMHKNATEQAKRKVSKLRPMFEPDPHLLDVVKVCESCEQYIPPVREYRFPAGRCKLRMDCGCTCYTLASRNDWPNDERCKQRSVPDDQADRSDRR